MERRRIRRRRRGSGQDQRRSDQTSAQDTVASQARRVEPPHVQELRPRVGREHTNTEARDGRALPHPQGDQPRAAAQGGTVRRRRDQVQAQGETRNVLHDTPTAQKGRPPVRREHQCQEEEAQATFCISYAQIGIEPSALVCDTPEEWGTLSRVRRDRFQSQRELHARIRGNLGLCDMKKRATDDPKRGAPSDSLESSAGKARSTTVPAAAAASAESGDNNDCPICFMKMRESGSCLGSALKCGHVYHPKCILEWMRRRIIDMPVTLQPPTCPVCQRVIKGSRSAFAQPPEILKSDPKLKALVKEISRTTKLMIPKRTRIPRREVPEPVVARDENREAIGAFPLLVCHVFKCLLFVRVFLGMSLGLDFVIGKLLNGCINAVLVFGAYPPLQGWYTLETTIFVHFVTSAYYIASARMGAVA